MPLTSLDVEQMMVRFRNFLRAQERLEPTVTSGLRLTGVRHVYNSDAETGN